MATAVAALEAERPRGRSLWSRRATIFWRASSTRLSAATIVLLLAVTLVPASWWPPSATVIDLTVPPHAPSLSAGPLLGTDNLGRDILYRVLGSARLTLLISGLATLFATTAGVLAGLAAGYFRGWVDQAVSRVVDLMLAFPALLLVLALVVALGQTAASVAVVLGLSGWAAYTRVIRSSVIALAGHEFVDAARAIGAGTARIILRHLLPNVVSAVIVMSTYNLAQFILIESAISFLGLGPAPPAVTWGIMIGDGRQYLFEQWWVTVFPGLAIVLTALAFNLLGDALRDAFDPRSVHGQRF